MSESDEESEGNLYEYPNGVLRNKLDIRDAEQLKRVEATFTALRLAELGMQPLPGVFDLDYLKSLHHHIFQDVYEWAGQLRGVDISKGTSRFAHFAYLESNARMLFQQLAAEQQLRGLSIGQFAARAAYYLGELNVLHPFREGNGRTQRAFFSALARIARYHLHWERISEERMVAASVQSLFHADNALLERIFLDIIEPL